MRLMGRSEGDRQPWDRIDAMVAREVHRSSATHFYGPTRSVIAARRGATQAHCQGGDKWKTT